MDAPSGLVLLLLGCKVMTNNPWGILWAGLQAKEASLVETSIKSGGNQNIHKRRMLPMC